MADEHSPTKLAEDGAPLNSPAAPSSFCRELKDVLVYIHTQRANVPSRGLHWCLPRCPGQVKFVNHS